MSSAFAARLRSQTESFGTIVVGRSGILNMNRNKVAVALILVLLLANSIAGQQTHPRVSQSQRARIFTEIKGYPEESPESFEFSIQKYKYKITTNGKGKRTGDSSSRSFNLHLNREDLLDRVIYYAEYQGDLLLICEVSDGDGGAGFITRLNGRTLRIKWKRWIPAFNIGQGLIEHKHAYLTAIGFIAKINIESGAYVWKHDDLYREEDTFNHFNLPKLLGDIALFIEDTIYDRPAKTIRVNKYNGKIISIGQVVR